jgi:DNA-binding response OmpR family regulator
MHASDALIPGTGDVIVLRWPEQEAHARRLDFEKRPQLLLVGPDAEPPLLDACTTDWIRMPANDADIRARLTTLATRAERHPAVPMLDGIGELTHRGRSIFVSPLEARVMEPLVRAFGRAVRESDLLEQTAPVGTPNRMRVYVSRLRKRIEPLGLAITSVRGYGYRLHDANLG